MSVRERGGGEVFLFFLFFVHASFCECTLFGLRVTLVANPALRVHASFSILLWLKKFLIGSKSANDELN